MLVVLLHAALLVQSTSAQNANKPNNQHVNVTKMSSVNQSMPTAVATSTTANATRTSVSIFLKKAAQLATLELLLILVLAVQLLNVVMSKPQQLQQLQQLLPLQQQPLLQLLILQSLMSHHLLHTQFVSILMETNDAMVKAGLLHLNHVQSTLATLSMTSVPPSAIVVTNELDARPMKLKSLMLLMNVALVTLVKDQPVEMSSAQKLSQNASTTKT
jgi:hypothetical protein